MDSTHYEPILGVGGGQSTALHLKHYFQYFPALNYKQVYRKGGRGLFVQGTTMYCSKAN